MPGKTTVTIDRTITYQELDELKQDDESFDDVIYMLVEYYKRDHPGFEDWEPLR